MKPSAILRGLAASVGLLGLSALVLPATAETIYFDDFNDQQNIDSQGVYTQTLRDSVPTLRSGTFGSSASATWLAGVEQGGWGQRDYADNNVATPTSSNFLPFTPDASRVYRLEATIDTTPLGGADPGGTNSWFTIGFTSSQHNWNGVDAATIAVGQLVRWNSNQVANLSYTLNGADLVAGGVQYIGWITDRAGTVNLNASAQVKIDNFRLIAGVANPTVTYDGNGSDGGSIPTDPSSPYTFGGTATVVGAGSMTRAGFNFGGWNTASNGSGTDYSPSATFSIYNDTTLYAKWIPVGSYTVTYSGNENTSGTAPVEASNPYAGGSSVTVLGNTGSLSRTSFTFSGWNTAADGSGTNYNPADTFTINADTTLYARWIPGPDFVWNNQTTTGTWNTSDANWSGAPWVNSASNNALFGAIGGSVLLDPSIVAGAVNVGSTGTNFTSLSLNDGDLTAASLTVQGFSSNGGIYNSNPTLGVNSAVTVSGDAAVGRANLAITGGTFTANRIISAAASADWARLVVSGGTVTATNGVDGSVNTGATFAIDLNGGELLAPSIRVADREAGFNNYAWLTFNGGTLKAIGGDNSNFITTYGGNQNTFVEAGGAIIDTNGFNIGINVNMIRSGSSVGSLTKDGEGTLTLGGSVYNYRGNTVINEGALNVNSGSELEFFPASSGVTNFVSAGSSTATLSFLGTVNLNLGAADTTNGNVWTIFDVASFSTAPVLTPGLVRSSLGNFTEVSEGTWELVVTNAKWVFTEADGNLAYVVTATDYDNWEVANGVTGGENDDDDADGLTNLEEYAFGTDPTGGSSVNPIVVPLDKATGTFSYTRRATPATTGLSYTVWTSTDLGTWTQDAGATEGTPSVSGEVETVPVTISSALLSNSKLFIQVRAD